MKIKNFVAIGLTGLLFAVSSCQKDVFNPEAPQPENPQKFVEANTFDFSTIQTVKLSVDYSAFQTYGPVFFSVYNENPFVGEGENEHIDEKVQVSQDGGHFGSCHVGASDAYLLRRAVYVDAIRAEQRIDQGRRPGLLL